VSVLSAHRLQGQSHTLFEPDREVAAWRSVEDCLKTIDRYLGDEAARSGVARSGKARTMAQHTYRHRAAEILGFVDTLRRGPLDEASRSPGRSANGLFGNADPAPAHLTSTDYRVLSGAEEARSAMASSRGWLAHAPWNAGARLPDLIAAMRMANRGSISRSRRRPSRPPAW